MDGLKEEKLDRIKIPTVKISSEITHEELYKLLKALPSPFLKNIAIYLVDRKYQLVEKREMERFLALDKTDLFDYVPEYFDCDDSSFRLMGQVSVPEWAGIAFGIAFSNVHAFNLFIGADKICYLIEPQSDEIWEISEIPKKHKKFYLPIRFILM